MDWLSVLDRKRLVSWSIDRSSGLNLAASIRLLGESDVGDFSMSKEHTTHIFLEASFLNEHISQDQGLLVALSIFL